MLNPKYPADWWNFFWPDMRWGSLTANPGGNGQVTNFRRIRSDTDPKQEA